MLLLDSFSLPQPDILEPSGFSVWFDLETQLAPAEAVFAQFLAEPQSCCGFCSGLFHLLSGGLRGWGRSPCPDTTFSRPSQRPPSNHKLEE